jgi:hypothetical protein
VFGPGRVKRLTATGDLFGAGQREVYVQGFTLSPGTGVSTFVLREGGSGGAIVGSWVFPANGAAVAFPLCFMIDRPHVTITGAAAEASFVF